MIKQYLIPVIIIMVLALASGPTVGCDAPDLPKEMYDQLFIVGNDKGYGWGYWLAFEAEGQGTHIALIADLIPPDRVDEFQKLNPEVNIRDFYTPKGYWTLEDVANMHLPDVLLLIRSRRSRQWKLTIGGSIMDLRMVLWMP